MKNVLIISLALVAVMATNGCKKCVDCRLTTTTTYSPQQTFDPPEPITVTFETCGTNKEIEDVEKTGTITATTTTQGITVTIKDVTRCN